MSTTLPDKTEPKHARRIQRIRLTLPVKIQGMDSKSEKWEEITRLKDISAFGAGFHLGRPIKRGRLVLLTLPMPRKMRCYDYLEPQYMVWGVVRRCIVFENKSPEEMYFVGVAFIGRVPPKSYLDDPSTVYEVTDRTNEGLWEVGTAQADPDEQHLPREDRRHSRYDIPMSVTIEVIDELGRTINREETVTENISLSGASVFSSIDLEMGSFITLKCDQLNVTIKAIVRGKRLGPDGIPRLHIEFINGFFPLEGIEI